MNVESLRRTARSQQPWFVHVTGISQERLAKRVLLATPTAKWPRGRLSNRWCACDYNSDLPWSRLVWSQRNYVPEVTENHEEFDSSWRPSPAEHIRGVKTYERCIKTNCLACLSLISTFLTTDICYFLQ